MARYILHGGYERWDNELNNTFYREIARTLPEGATLLLVYFASEDPEPEVTFREQSIRIQNLCDKELNITLADEKDFIAQLEAADAVHMRGGSTDKLLTTLKQYSDLPALLDKKEVVSGSSAGAYALAKYGTGHSAPHVREGLGLVPVRLVCHFESSDLPQSPESYEELLHMAPEMELVQLRDCEWRVFEKI